MNSNENRSQRTTTINSIEGSHETTDQVAGYSRATTVNENHGNISRATTANENLVVSRNKTTINEFSTNGSNATTINELDKEMARNPRKNPDRSNNTTINGVSAQPTTPNSQDVEPLHEFILPPPTLELAHTDGLAEGTNIDGYTIGELINKKSGEALLYKCVSDKGKVFALKYFQRDLSEEDIVRHDELLSKLKGIKEGVVQILSSGLYNGHLYEIMPYYSAGSLKDKLERLKKQKKNPFYFTEKEIAEDILPRILSILKSIHDQGIYHADIKPENIMYKSSRSKDLVLIDFGVSKVTKGRGTTFVTIVGGTVDYQAPEMFTGTLWEGTDYYALGITLYELMVGATPTSYKQNSIDVERAAMIDEIPRIDGMSNDIYRLIYYLTYDSVRNRHDRSNHNNRWLHQEASKWPADGWDKTIITGDGLPRDHVFVRFGGKVYETMDELVFAMAGDWDRGSNFVARPDGGLIAGLAKSANRDRRLVSLSSEVSNFVELATKSGQSEDTILFEFIYQYGHDIETVFWKGNSYKTLDLLGKAVFRSLGSDSSPKNPFYELFADNLLEIYMRQRNDLPNVDREKIERICKINFQTGGLYEIYKAAYILMDDKYYYQQNGEIIKSPAALKAYLAREGAKGNLHGFMNLCKEFIDESGNEKDGFRAWIDANKGTSSQAIDVQKEIGALSSIERTTSNAQFPSSISVEPKSKKRFSIWGILFGVILLAITVAPFTLFIMELNDGSIAEADTIMQYVYLIAAIGLPIIPIIIARLLCISRNRVTNTCFKFVTVVCRILKYDVLATAAALVFDQYSSISVVNLITRIIRSGYAWILQNLRIVIGDLGTNEILNSLAMKMNITYSWFNDAARLSIVFVIYTLIIAVFRRRKVK